MVPSSCDVARACGGVVRRDVQVGRLVGEVAQAVLVVVVLSAAIIGVGGHGEGGARVLGHLHCVRGGPVQRAKRPRDPGGVAAFMSAHSKTPYITPSMEFSSGEGVVRGRRVQQLTFTLIPRPLTPYV